MNTVPAMILHFCSSPNSIANLEIATISSSYIFINL